MEPQTREISPNDPQPTPRDPQAPPDHHDHPAENTKVTPLDEDKHVEKGIEINET